MDSSFVIFRVTDWVSAAELDLLFDCWFCLSFIAGVPGSAAIRGCGGHWLSSVRSHKITAHERTAVPQWLCQNWTGFVIMLYASNTVARCIVQLSSPWRDRPDWNIAIKNKRTRIFDWFFHASKKTIRKSTQMSLCPYVNLDILSVGGRGCWFSQV